MASGPRPRPGWERGREGLRSRLLVRRQPVGVVGARGHSRCHCRSRPRVLTGGRRGASAGEQTESRGGGRGVRGRRPAAWLLHVVPPAARSASSSSATALVRRSVRRQQAAGRRIAGLCGEQIERAASSSAASRRRSSCRTRTSIRKSRRSRPTPCEQRPDLHERDSRAGDAGALRRRRRRVARISARPWSAIRRSRRHVGPLVSAVHASGWRTAPPGRVKARG